MSKTTAPVPVGRLMLKGVRLSFPALFEPEAFKPGDKPKYKATFLMPKDSPLVKQIEAKIKAVMQEKFPKKMAVIEQIRSNPMRFCFQDGDNKEYDGYSGMMALSAKSDVRPLCLDGQRNPVTAEDGVIYGGCYVNASVEIFAYDNSGIGISAQVRGVQFAAAGDSFAAGRPADSDEFEDVADGADAGDFA